MDRSQLLRLMPRDKNDVDGARTIVDIGLPAAAPILPDIIRQLRVHDSVVAQLFAALLANQPEHCWQHINHELHFGRDDGTKHVIVALIIPQWPLAWLAKVASGLQTTLTHTNFFDTDLRCIDLLERHALCERAWLKSWLDFKSRRLSAHSTLAQSIAARFEQA